MNDLYTLRQGREDDLKWLNSYNYAEGMDNLDSIENVVVAVNESDEPVGYIRISFGESGTAYVNPVVVHSLWRGYDVGKTLVMDALVKYKELRLVSRGASIGFYKTLGFIPCGWDEIEDDVSEDCANCSWRDECGPLPMKAFSQ